MPSRHADRVDLLCAFVKWHGLRVLEESLRAGRLRGGRSALSRRPTSEPPSVGPWIGLVQDFNAEVKVNYEPGRRGSMPRLGCFGVRAATTPRTSAAPTSPRPRCSMVWSGTSGCHPLRRPTCSENSRPPSRPTGVTPPSRPTTPKPTPPTGSLGDRRGHLEKPAADRGITCPASKYGPTPINATCWSGSEVEREVHDRHRNLLVAATGTGKTVMAALDYKHCARSTPAVTCGYSSSPTAKRSCSSPCGPTKTSW